MITKEILIAAGEAAFGKSWKTALAQELNINRQRIRQWLKGERPLPDLSDDLLLVLEKRKQLIEFTQNQLKNNRGTPDGK